MADLIKITVVTGWAIDGAPGGSKVHMGHLDLQEAIAASGDTIQVKDGAYVDAWHDYVVNRKPQAHWSGNVD